MKQLFNLFFLSAFTIILYGCKVKQHSPKNTKPNIVFICSDDHATNAISAYGGIFKNSAPTPNIDRIANEGA